MKRFFERLPAVWKYDSTFRVLVYLLGVAWLLCLHLIILTIINPSFVAGVLTGFCVTYATILTIRLIQEM